MGRRRRECGRSEGGWGGVFISNDALCKFSFFSESPSLYPFFLFYIYFPFLPLLFLLLFLSLVSFEMSSPPNSFGLQAHGKAKNVFYIILNHEAVWNELLGSNEPLLWNISPKQSAEAAHLKLAVCGDEEADYHICPTCLFSSSPTFPFRLSPRKARCTLSFSTVFLSSLSLVSRALLVVFSPLQLLVLLSKEVQELHEF